MRYLMKKTLTLNLSVRWIALTAAVLFLPIAGAAETKPTQGWPDLARKSQDAGFSILPILAIQKALETETLSATEKNRLVRLATRLSAHTGTGIAAMALSQKITNEDQIAEWQWFSGLADLEKGDMKGAAEHFRMVRRTNRNFPRARYQLALIAYNEKRNAEAETRFKEILEAKPAPDNDLQDLTRLALGRIWYEQKKFQSAAAAYRTVSRNGPQFKTALFEQSWALFMAGFPNHALGAIHGIESPFFKDSFNPEATLLRSIILYWMCSYSDSDRALQEFIARHADPIDRLDNFLARQQLIPDAAWELFENMIVGVSGESLGIPRPVLLTAAASDRMIPLRAALAQTTQEIQKIEQGKFSMGSDVKDQAAKALLREHLSQLRTSTGKKFVIALEELRSQYEQLRAQADFLYVELLTSEKDKLLGKEHLASNKFSAKQANGKRPAGWGKSQLAWAPNTKQEYWWDEVGFYIDPAKAACVK
jgi:tetratricopeptide (TPR) repeat protein